MGIWQQMRGRGPTKKPEQETPSGQGGAEEAPQDGLICGGAMRQAIRLWRDIYLNRAPWLGRGVESLNLGAVVASEVARMVTMEMESQVVGCERLDKLYQRLVMSGIRQQAEYGLALGGLIFKPFVSGTGDIGVDFVQPQSFFVTGVADSGRIEEIVFTDTCVLGDKAYHRLEIHRYNEAEKCCVIRNKAYESGLGLSYREGREVPLGYVPVWKDIWAETELRGVEGPLFGYFRPAMANNVEPESPLGVSIYAKATDAIRRADIQLSSLVREYRVKEAKQYVDEVAIPPNGVLPYLEDDYYIRMDGSGDTVFFEAYSPEIREESYLKGLNEHKREIEDCIGLAHGTLSNAEQMVKTATELKMSRQKTYVTVADNQKALRYALEELVYALGYWYRLLGGEVEKPIAVQFDFDDSIVTERDTEFQQYIRLYEAGVISREEMRAFCRLKA